MIRDSAIIIAIFFISVRAQDINSSSSVEEEIICIDPDRFGGVCKGIEKCPSILNEFISGNNGSDYMNYIQESQNSCEKIASAICCPFDGVKNKLPDNFQGRLLTPDEGCGFSNKNARVKLARGHRARLGAFPWLALIGYTNNINNNVSWECGGTLITTRHILTAASCVTPNLSVVRLGAFDITAPRSVGVHDIKIIRSVKHPNYNEQDHTSDIAILYLERDVNISARIRPICLPFIEPVRSQSFVDFSSIVAGWGKWKNDAKFNSTYEAFLPVIDHKACAKQYREQQTMISENQFNDGIICTAVKFLDNCINDIGGPLIQTVEEFDYRYHLIGVASYGVSSCNKTDALPSVYTKVQYFIDWIEENINL